MVFQYLHLPNFRAFKRLTDRELSRNAHLATDATLSLVLLATEHGISREEAEEIVDMCCDEQTTRTKLKASNLG